MDNLAYFEKYLTAIHDAQEQRFKSLEARLQEILAVINTYRAEGKEYQIEYEHSFKEYRDEADKKDDEFEKRLKFIEIQVTLMQNEMKIVKWFAAGTGAATIGILIQTIASKLL